MINYPVSMLTSVSDCDAILSFAAQEQQGLEWKKNSLEHQKERCAGKAAAISAELEAKQAELAALDAMIAALPEGDTKDAHIQKRARTAYRILLLETRQTKYGDLALFDKALELQIVQRRLEETAAFIAAVEARKAAL